jgi:phosphomannomutase
VAAGLLIQRLPVEGEGNLAGSFVSSANEDAIGVNEDYNRIATLAASLTAQELLELDVDTVLRRLFWDEKVLRFAPQTPRFACSCSRDRVSSMIRSLGQQEAEDIVAERGETVEAIVRDHWARFGRNYYTRYDYEAVPTDAANGVMALLRDRLSSLPGAVLAGRTVQAADDFSYTDPVDGSVSAKQGIRVLFIDGARIVYRLSGTGTEGATIRVYIESKETAADRLGMETAEALRELVAAALDLAEIAERTGREAPTVIT